MNKWAKPVAIFLLLFSAVSLSGAYYLIHRSNSVIDGVVVVKGLSQQVRIIRDIHGIPHIFAQNRADLAFGLGYAEAQDRLWQLDLLRHVGRGTVSAVFGSYAKALQADLLFRTVFHHPDESVFIQHAWESLTPETREELTAFAQGVNAFVLQHRHQLPIEFFALGHQFEPFEAIDCAWVAAPMHWGLSLNLSDEVLAAKLAGSIGVSRLSELFPEAPETSLPEEAGQRLSGTFLDLRPVPRRTKVDQESLDSLTRVGRELAASPFLGAHLSAGTPASNSWVVGGQRTTTGKPILASDPHLPFTLPSVWYEAHLVAPGVDVIGIAYPGMPYIAIGHNRDIAWGTSAVTADTQDLFIEKVNPHNSRQVWFRDHWEDLQARKILLPVKGQEPVEKELLFTRHGPVITPLFPGLTETLTLQWVGMQEGLTFNSPEGFRLLNRAANWQEFRTATEQFFTVNMNIMYADVKGNIGWQVVGKIPLRAKGTGQFPAPGWTGEHEWTGFIPFEALPSYYLPSQGVPQMTGNPVSSAPTHAIATANQRIVHADYPYHLSNSWVPPYRFLRISQLLGQQDKVSVQDIQQYQADQYPWFADLFVPLLEEVPEETEEVRLAKRLLRDWDRRVTKESVAATLYELTVLHVMNNTYRDELGELYPDYAARFGFLWTGLDVILQQPQARWWDDIQTPVMETRADILRKSIQEAVEEARQRLGADPAGWQWGRLHLAVFAHPLGRFWPLDWLLNRSVPAGGDGYTVNMGYYSLNRPFAGVAGPAFRMVVNLSDIRQAFAMNTTGQSGRPFTPHYDDMIHSWAEVEYHPMWMDEVDILAHAEGVLLLTPEASPILQAP